MTVNPMEGLLEDVDFVVSNEDYSRFVIIPDKTVIKAKVVVRKILFTVERTPEGYPTGLQIDAMNAVTSVVPSSIKQPPSTEPWNPQQDKGEEVKFEEEKVITQEYHTTNGFKVTIRPVLAKVFRYGKYNVYGEPIYTVSLQSILNIDKISNTTDTK